MGKPLSKNNVRAGANPYAFLDATAGALDAIASSGEMPVYPPPIGGIVRYARSGDGVSGSSAPVVLLENQAGAVFVVGFTGPIAGPLSGRLGNPAPSWDAILADPRILADGRGKTLNLPSSGLPTGTLPGGLEWSAPDEGSEQDAPDGAVDLAGASSGMGWGWIAALLAGAWWAKNQ